MALASDWCGVEDLSTIMSVELTDNLRQPQLVRIGGLQCHWRIAEFFGKAESETLKTRTNDVLSWVIKPLGNHKLRRIQCQLQSRLRVSDIARVKPDSTD
jgi:hypothetical protein